MHQISLDMFWSQKGPQSFFLRFENDSIWKSVKIWWSKVLNEKDSSAISKVLDIK